MEIIETGGAPKSSSKFHKTGDGRVTYTYVSAKLTVKLEDEILTVNGRKYLIPKKDDSVRIKDADVEINGHPAKPVDEVEAD